MLSKNLRLFSCLLFAAFTLVQKIPRSSHVWKITEDNHSHEGVAGNSQLRYYNQLIHQYGLATQFDADHHSSLPALMWFVAGAPVELDNDTTSCAHFDDNVLRQLLKWGLLTREEKPPPCNPCFMPRRDHVSAGKLEMEAGLQARS